MVGIPQRRDYDKEVIDKIRELGRSKSISKMATTLKMRNENISSSLKNLCDRGLLEKHDDESYPYYTPMEDSAEGHLHHIEKSIEFYRKQIDIQTKKLSKKKIFINVKIKKTKHGGKITTYKINPEIKNQYTGFIFNLNYLQSLMPKIQLLQILKIIPKTDYYNRKSEKLQDLIFEQLKSSLHRLEHEHSTQRDLLKRNLESEIPILPL